MTSFFVVLYLGMEDFLIKFSVIIKFKNFIFSRIINIFTSNEKSISNCGTDSLLDVGVFLKHRKT